MLEISALVMLIEKFAPTLSKSLLHESGKLLISALEKTFGVSQDDLITAIQNDPDAQNKLSDLERSNQALIAQYASQNYASAVNDRESARDREVKITEITKKRDYIIDFIAVLFIIFFFIVCIMNYYLPVKDDSVMTLLVGQISGGVGLVLAYYYGSSNSLR